MDDLSFISRRYINETWLYTHACDDARGFAIRVFRTRHGSIVVHELGPRRETFAADFRINRSPALPLRQPFCQPRARATIGIGDFFNTVIIRVRITWPLLRPPIRPRLSYVARAKKRAENSCEKQKRAAPIIFPNEVLSNCGGKLFKLARLERFDPLYFLQHRLPVMFSPIINRRCEYVSWSPCK